MLPLVGSLPLQAPLAVQEVAFIADQVSVALWPATIVVGCTLRVIAGVGGGGALPPPPPPQEDSNSAPPTGTRSASPQPNHSPRVRRIRNLPAVSGARTPQSVAHI